MKDEEMKKLTVNTNETLIVNLTNKVTELTKKLDKINAIVWKTEHKVKDLEKIKAIIMGVEE